MLLFWTRRGLTNSVRDICVNPSQGITLRQWWMGGRVRRHRELTAPPDILGPKFDTLGEQQPKRSLRSLQFQVDPTWPTTAAHDGFDHLETNLQGPHEAQGQSIHLMWRNAKVTNPSSRSERYRPEVQTNKGCAGLLVQIRNGPVPLPEAVQQGSKIQA